MEERQADGESIDVKVTLTALLRARVVDLAGLRRLLVEGVWSIQAAKGRDDGRGRHRDWSSTCHRELGLTGTDARAVDGV